MENFLNTIGIAMRARKVVTGEDATVESVRKSKAHLVLLASDAGKNTSKKIRDKCLHYNVLVIEDFTISEISKAIGKSNRVVIAITDRGFAQSLIKRRGDLDGKEKTK